MSLTVPDDHSFHKASFPTLEPVIFQKTDLPTFSVRPVSGF